MTIFRQAFCALFFLFSAAPALAAGQKRPLNPRKKRPGSAAPAAPGVARAPERLLGGRWTPGAEGAVRALLEARGSAAASYDPNVPPAAALAVDGAAYAVGDPSEAVFRKLVVEVQFKFSEEFWKLVPLGFGRQKIRAAYEQFSALPRSIWPQQPAYRQYRKYFLASYLDTCAKVGRKECRSYLAKLLIGYTDEEVREYARAAMDEEAAQKPRLDMEREHEADPEAVAWQRGLVPVPEFAALVAVLRGAGLDVWAVAPQAQPILVEAAARAGVDPSRVLGIKQFHERERLIGQLREPVPVRGGAVDAFVKALARPPAFTLAGRPEDLELLGYTAGTKLFIDAGDAGAAKRAAAQGAVLQPAFAAVPQAIP